MAAVRLLEQAQRQNLPWLANALKAIQAWANGDYKTSTYLTKDEAAQVFKKGANIDAEVERAYVVFSRAAGACLTDGQILRQALRLEPSIHMTRIPDLGLCAQSGTGRRASRPAYPPSGAAGA